MELKKIELSKIKPYEKNARKNDEAVEYVVKSIEQCEYIAPIILDENNVILAGHTRWKALKKLGYKEAECVIKEGLTEEQKKKYRLLDNKTAEIAEWDFDLLKNELEDLDFEDLDISWGESIKGIEYTEMPTANEYQSKPATHIHFLLTIDYDNSLAENKIINFCEEENIEYERTYN